MQKVISVANQKGGVGKTDLTVNLSTVLAMGGNKILLIDMDPQGSATHYITSTDFDTSITEVLLDGASIDDVIIPSCVKGLDLVPATIGLGGAQIRLATDVNMQFKLRQALKASKKKYDYILIDTPPSLGILTVNSFAASDGVLVPVQPNFFSLKGLSDLLETVNKLHEMINPKLELFGVVITMYDKRTNLSKEIEEMLKRRFDKKLFTTHIPVAVKLAESPGHKKPILQYAPKHKVSDAYRTLSEEFIKCVKN